MPAAGVEVGIHLAQVDVEQAERLRAVDEGQDAALPGEATQLSRGEEVADRAREVGEGQHLRLRGQGLREGVDVVLRSRVRAHGGDDVDRVPVAPRLLLPGDVVARMVVREEEDLVAGFQVEPARDQVVGLAGVPGDDDLLRGDAQELGQGFPRDLLGVSIWLR